MIVGLFLGDGIAGVEKCKCLPLMEEEEWKKMEGRKILRKQMAFLTQHGVPTSQQRKYYALYSKVVSMYLRTSTVQQGTVAQRTNSCRPREKKETFCISGTLASCNPLIQGNKRCNLFLFSLYSPNVYYLPHECFAQEDLTWQKYFGMTRLFINSGPWETWAMIWWGKRPVLDPPLIYLERIRKHDWGFIYAGVQTGFITPLPKQLLRILVCLIFPQKNPYVRSFRFILLSFFSASTWKYSVLNCRPKNQQTSTFHIKRILALVKVIRTHNVRVLWNY